MSTCMTFHTMDMETVFQMWRETEIYPVWVRLAAREHLADRACIGSWRDIVCLMRALGLNTDKCPDLAKEIYKDWEVGIMHMSEILHIHCHAQWESI